MKIYIPQYLRDIPVLSQLSSMYEIFANLYKGGNESSFSAYRESLKRDPVKYFVNMCLSDNLSSGNISEETYINIVNYITHLFYCVKGTRKVFDYMHEFLDDFLHLIELEPGRYGRYDGRHIEVRFNNLVVTDGELFYTSLIKFFDALLVFEDIKTNIEIEMEIKDEIANFIVAGLVCYKKFNIEEEDINEVSN